MLIKITGAPPGSNVTIEIKFDNTITGTLGNPEFVTVQINPDRTATYSLGTVEVPAGSTRDTATATGSTTIGGTTYTNSNTAKYDVKAETLPITPES